MTFRFNLCSFGFAAILLSALGIASPSARAQGSSLGSFTYQGRLNDVSGPANGLFDFQFSLYSSSMGPGQIDTTITSLFLPVTNGLFTVQLSFPMANSSFNGSDRWLEIAVKPGGVATNYIILSPRQQITATPYAIRAGSAASAATAQSVSGPVPATQITGTISTANLPPINNGAPPLAPGGIVMSDDPTNAALAAQGYTRVPNAEITLAVEAWVQKNPPADRTEFIRTQRPFAFSGLTPRIVTSVGTGTELVVFRTDVFNDAEQYYSDEILIYNAVTHQWRRALWLPLGTFAPGATAVWTGSQVLLWGGANGRIDEDLGDFGGTVYDFPTKVVTYSPASNQYSELNGNGTFPRGRSGHTAVWTGSQMLIWGGGFIEYRPTSQSGIQATTYFATNGLAFNPTTGQWTTMNAVGGPSPRYGYAMVWTGTRMIVQGGSTNNNWLEWFRWELYGATANDLVNSGYSYNPQTDTWSPIRSDGTAPRIAYGQAVWTGKEMFVYGGKEPTYFSFLSNGDGTVGKWMLVPQRLAYSYNPTNDLWTLRGVSDPGSPVWGGRRDFMMVWSGTEVIVSGGWGFDDLNYTMYERTNSQAYNMTSGTWRTLPAQPFTTNLYSYTAQAAWVGNQMVIHDNRTMSYSAVSNSWTVEPNYFGPLPLNPIDPSVIWTGKEFILWGGMNNGVPSNRGRRFNPATGLWTELSTTNAPTGRTRHSAVWTGTRMVIWGGDGGGDPLYPAVVHAGGSAYDPATDTWITLPAPPTDPNTGSIFARTGHKAVSTIYGMVVVGGSDGYNGQGQNFPRTIARLSPNLATWTLSANVPVEVGRFQHCLSSDGNRTIFLWGGQDQVDSGPIGNGTFLIDASTLTASEMDNADQSQPARNPTVVWSGKEFIVWGGTLTDGTPLGGGSKFNPDSDFLYWTPLSVGGPALTTRHAGHTAVWSGTEMLIWGGTTNTFGARYNPRNDMWTPMAVGPTMRTGGKAVWSGTNMLLYLPALPTSGAIPELWQYQPPAKTYLYLKL